MDIYIYIYNPLDNFTENMDNKYNILIDQGYFSWAHGENGYGTVVLSGISLKPRRCLVSFIPCSIETGMEPNLTTYLSHYMYRIVFS